MKNKKITVKKVIANIIYICSCIILLLLAGVTVLSVIVGIVTTIQEGKGFSLLVELGAICIPIVILILIICLANWVSDNK